MRLSRIRCRRHWLMQPAQDLIHTYSKISQKVLAEVRSEVCDTIDTKWGPATIRSSFRSQQYTSDPSEIIWRFEDMNLIEQLQPTVMIFSRSCNHRANCKDKITPKKEKFLHRLISIYFTSTIGVSAFIFDSSIVILFNILELIAYTTRLISVTIKHTKCT